MGKATMESFERLAKDVEELSKKNMANTEAVNTAVTNVGRLSASYNALEVKVEALTSSMKSVQTALEDLTNVAASQPKK